MEGTDSYPDIDHTNEGAITAWDNGNMDAFDLLTPDNPSLPYVEYCKSDIAVYWQYAHDYVVADEIFTSVMGPSLLSKPPLQHHRNLFQYDR